ncbi:MAG TPA: ammonium transporter [bacterium]|nr:ammonium transporter [bacterium]
MHQIPVRTKLLAVGAALLVLFAFYAAALYAQSPPAATPAPAAEPAGDPTGATLTTPNAFLAGWASGVSSKPDGSDWTAFKDPENPTTKELAADVAHAFYSINFVWTLVAGFLVMFMQAGFAMVETGLIRAKNVGHTMAMNFMVYGVGMTGFFVMGFALLCGGVNGSPIGGPGALGGIAVLNKMFTISVGGHDWGLFGTTGFFLSGHAYDAAAIVWFLFMMVFMDTTATIPTGAAAERWKYSSFFVFSFFIGAIIYPIYGNWLWGGGWLAELGLNAGLAHGAVDYAGSSVVHLQGGALALVLAIMIGPRLGKFDSEGRPRPIVGHNIPMAVIGTFILAFGWFGFNAGSSLAGTDGRIGIIAANTMLASAAGAIGATVYHWWFHKKPDVSMMCNGMLAGLVAITAPCSFVTPWAAYLIGLIAGVLVVVSVYFWERLGIDDPVGAISVHGVNGVWGMLALGLFADGTYGAGWNGVGFSSYLGTAGQGVTGLFYGDGKQFLAEVIASVSCIAWNVAAGAFFFWLTGLIVGGNRVSEEIERQGLDVPEMGAPGYTGLRMEDAEALRA